jgi:hypothetical protein
VTQEEAKRILLLYRPGVAEQADFAEALSEARRDPDLAGWLERHLATQAALRDKFSEIIPPPELKDRILGQRKIVRPVWWRRQPAWLAAAASIALLIGLTLWFTRPPKDKYDRFADYRTRMVQIVLREYRMDISTNNAESVRQYLQSRGAPADYTLPKGLNQVAVKGGGLLRWRGQPVSMVCFDRGNRQLLYLFVLDRTGLKDAPPETTEVVKVKKLTTASWSSGDKTYVLASEEDPDAIRRYL